MVPAPAWQKFTELRGFKRTGDNQYQACCPVHDDHDPSLSIGVGDDGRILLDCKAGCDTKQILKTLGLEARDLFARRNGNGQKPGKIVATYDYRDENGELISQSVRYKPKHFSQRRSDGNGGWISGKGCMEGVKRVPYRLSELLKTKTVFVTEGEKDCDNLRKLGLTATTNNAGAGLWTDDLSKYFRDDQHITILPDNDKPGRDHAQKVAQSLQDHVASIKILELKGLPDKGDVSDWLIGRDPKAAKRELLKLAKAAPEWSPSVTEEEDEPSFVPPGYWHDYDVADIRNWKCPPLEPVIEGILAKGNLLWLAAETQTGKTLFMLWVCLRLLNKGRLFDRFAITPVKKILYLACEDPARRFKARLEDMTKIAIGAGRFIVYVVPGLSLADPACFEFLESRIQKGGFDLVVLDTWQAATPGIASYDDEKLGVIFQRLLGITRKLGVTIIVNDHFRKTANSKKRTELDPNDVKGSGGKLQNADVYLLMDQQNGQLRIAGKSKEWDHKIGFLLDVSPQGAHGVDKFTFAGEFEEGASDRKLLGKANQQRIFAALQVDVWTRPGDVARIVGLSGTTVSNHLATLLGSGRIESRGKSRSIEYRALFGNPENGKSGDRTHRTRFGKVFGNQKNTALPNREKSRGDSDLIGKHGVVAEKKNTPKRSGNVSLARIHSARTLPRRGLPNKVAESKRPENACEEHNVKRVAAIGARVVIDA